LTAGPWRRGTGAGPPKKERLGGSLEATTPPPAIKRLSRHKTRRLHKHAAVCYDCFVSHIITKKGQRRAYINFIENFAECQLDSGEKSLRRDRDGGDTIDHRGSTAKEACWKVRYLRTKVTRI